MIKLNNISKFYQSPAGQITKKTCGLREASLDINEGDFISFVGNTGSGKTTLISIIGLILEPDSGEIIFKNRRISGYGNALNRLRAEYYSYILQKNIFFDNLNLLDNILLPVSLLREPGSLDRQKALDMLQILKFRSSPQALPDTLSMGEQKKCALVRALLKPSAIILADEPTASLDEESADLALHMLKDENKKGRAVVLVTHSRKYTKYSKNIYQLSEGKIEKCLK
ncbi:MAG: hypothetical protein A2096_07700 [Spirochaetes bacterium GWF1_41_5]|nr:MAG: hypothetical protein A2096_07700 [Spirochaetes bacterium GWF1_41_5]HBE03727.1 hypothetical protein [Spirochaetia bacterium]